MQNGCKNQHKIQIKVCLNTSEKQYKTKKKFKKFLINIYVFYTIFIAMEQAGKFAAENKGTWDKSAQTIRYLYLL